MSNEELEELKSIKKLLMFGLVRDGVSSEEIAKTLGITARTIRRTIPMRQIKKKTK